MFLLTRLSDVDICKPFHTTLSSSEPFPFYVALSVMGGPKLLTVFKVFHSVTGLSTMVCFFGSC